VRIQKSLGKEDFGRKGLFRVDSRMNNITAAKRVLLLANSISKVHP
jgi:hypothetical protein